MELRTDLPYWQVIDLPDGAVTPGKADHRGHPGFLNIDDPELLRGKRVLDTAANDGFWSFWAEQQGAADVLATDVDRLEDYDWGYAGPPATANFDKRRDTVFYYLHERMASKVRHETINIYDHDPAKIGEFDLVLCYGLIYHLRHPLKAIDALRRVCRGACVIETHSLLSSVDVPLMAFYEDTILDGAMSNWCGPTVACMTHWMKSAGFDAIYVRRDLTGDRQLFVGAVDEPWISRFDNNPNLQRCDDAYFARVHDALRAALEVNRSLDVTLSIKPATSTKPDAGTPDALLQIFFEAMLGRPADQRALNHYVPQLVDGLSPDQLRIVLLTSPEMRTRLLDAAAKFKMRGRLAKYCHELADELDAAKASPLKRLARAVPNALKRARPALTAPHTAAQRPAPAASGAVNRVMLLSMPKAGTYLLSELVRQLGFHQTNLHLHLDQMDAYDPEEEERGRMHPEEFRLDIPIENAARLIRSGEFGAGHLPCYARVIKALDGCKLVFAHREVRKALVSRMRFDWETQRYPELNTADWFKAHDLAEYIRQAGAQRIGTYERAAPWMQRPGVFGVSFDDLRDPASGVAARLAEFLGAPVTGARARHQQAMDAGSMTKARTELRIPWTDAAEAAFQETAGPAVNRLLGYDD